MPTITVKDMPDELYDALKKRDLALDRSIKRRISHYIEQAVRGRGKGRMSSLAHLKGGTYRK